MHGIVVVVDQSTFNVWLSRDSRNIQLSRKLLPKEATIGSIVDVRCSYGEVLSCSLEGSTLLTRTFNDRLQIADVFLLISPREAFSFNLGFVNSDHLLSMNLPQSDCHAFLLYAEFELLRRNEKSHVKDRFYIWNQPHLKVFNENSNEFKQLKQELSFYPTPFREGEWLPGVISGFHHSSSSFDKLFFVSTPKGPLVVYPRTQRDHVGIELQLGTYLRVQAIPRRDLGRGSCNGEVMRMETVHPPEDHNVIIENDAIVMECDAMAKKEEQIGNSSWCIFHNDFLGQLGLLARKLKVNVHVGDTARVRCKRVKSPLGGDWWWEVMDVVNIMDGKSKHLGSSSSSSELELSSGNSELPSISDSVYESRRDHGNSIKSIAISERHVCNILRELMMHSEVQEAMRNFDEDTYNRLVHVVYNTN